MKHSKLNTIILLFILLFTTACSTLEHHNAGNYYSGVSKVGDKEKTNYGPNGGIGVGMLFLPIIDGIFSFIYVPIDFVFSGVTDTGLLPVDYLMRDSYLKKKKLNNAQQKKDMDYALILYKTDAYINEYPLITAIAKDDTQEIQTILSEGTSEINATDSFGRTPIDYALKKKNTQIIQALIQNGIQNDLLFVEYISPDADLEMVKYLIKTDVQKRDIFEYPLLNKAIRANRVDILEYFLTLEDKYKLIK